LSIELEVRQKDLVSEGRHKARIVEVAEPGPSLLDPSKKSIRLMFLITAGDYEGSKLSKYVNAIVSEKSKLGRLYQALVSPLPQKGSVDISKLNGRECVVRVIHRNSGTRDIAVIEEVNTTGEQELFDE